MTDSNILVVIPARGGSKGIPGKNIKLLGGKPLLQYSLELAGQVAGEVTVCISTDDPDIAAVAESLGCAVPFLRPQELSGDTAGTYEVLLHALDHYEREQGVHFDRLLLLQPTSPFRRLDQVVEALDLYERHRPQMVVSVVVSPANPYYNLFEEQDGKLVKSKPGDFVRRQDCPEVFQYNGAIYVIDVAALRKAPLHHFTDVRKLVMDADSSLDLDVPRDWAFAEWLLAAKTGNHE